MRLELPAFATGEPFDRQAESALFVVKVSDMGYLILIDANDQCPVGAVIDRFAGFLLQPSDVLGIGAERFKSKVDDLALFQSRLDEWCEHSGSHPPCSTPNRTAIEKCNA